MVLAPTLIALLSVDAVTLPIATVLKMGLTILFCLVAPLGLGLAFRHFKSEHATRVLPFVRSVANLLLALLFVGLLIVRGHLLLGAGLDLLLASVLLLAFTLCTGSVFFNQQRPVRVSITFISGFRNLVLAMLLASAYFDQVTLMTVMTYGLLMFVATVLGAVWMGRRSPG